MDSKSKKIDELRRNFDFFLKNDVIGHYDYFEVFEIFGMYKGGSPFNVLTLLIASENLNEEEPEYLGNRIRVNSKENPFFGIKRSTISPEALREVIDRWYDEKIWQMADRPINIGELRPLVGNFVPSNSINSISINRIIKNNFFNGSHVIELFDVTKIHVRSLFSDVKALEALSKSISNIIPIDVASISDRLGNIIIQFPVDAVRTEFRTDGSTHSVEVAWHHKSEPRELLAISSTYYDQTPVSFGCAVINSDITSICADNGVGILRSYIWDTKHEILLAATDDCAPIKRMHIDMQPMMHEPRVFPKSLNKNADQMRVKLKTSSLPSQIGDFEIEAITDPVQSRIYDEERRELARRRTFVQYGELGRTTQHDRERALKDLRELINQHGEVGVWLWDPYLSAQDVLDSLFWNINSDSEMRALTLLKEPQQGQNAVSSTKSSKMMEFSAGLKSLQDNFLGVNIEFRSAHGPNGWDFHDRFLIFPSSGVARAQAWSLGTSLNSFGKTHHILQQVDNAQLVASAFEELWSAVSEAQNLIWKYT